MWMKCPRQDGYNKKSAMSADRGLIGSNEHMQATTLHQARQSVLRRITATPDREKTKVKKYNSSGCGGTCL
jgi:hypothetical protein